MRRRCVEQGAAAVLGSKRQLNHRPGKPDGAAEAHLIAMDISQPQEGRAGWTLQLLAEGLVEREIVDSISPETVRRTLKKTNPSPG